VSSVFGAKTYVEFISHCIATSLKSRGSIKALAERIQCHPTFISQVVRHKAHFNHEQAVRFCSYYQLTEDEAEFFIDLLNHDRAGTPEAKKHFQKIIDRKLLDRKSLQKRAKIVSALRAEQEVRYLASWVPCAVHAAIQIPDYNSPEKVARTLGLDINLTLETLSTLQQLGLIEEEKGRWVATQESLHIGKDSPLSSTYHTNWRLKTASRLGEKRRTLRQTHFSSVYAITNALAEEIREIIIQNLQEIRGRMVAAPSEELHVLCLDFYPLAHTDF